MEAIGSLAGGIAHDFNNILTPILGYTEMMLAMPGTRDDMRGFMAEILAASQRAKDLVTQILTFSRQSDGDLRSISVSQIIREVLALMRASLPPTIEIKRAIKTENDKVLADSTQLHQVLMNLCTNAGHALKEDGGALEVTLSDLMLAERVHSEFPSLPGGHYVRITVKDNGTGMDAATMERVFEPFFTTKRSGEGTGMGLSVAHGIVTSYHGGISVESREGEGTSFHVVLPVAEEESVPQQKKVVGDITGGGQRILFVDDEPSIVKMEGQLLSALGYDPELYTQSPDALAAFEEDPAKFDLVITDQVMPEMTGCELAERILELRPDMPIILCTGFTETCSAEDAEKIGIRDFLMKPVSKRELAESIHKLVVEENVAPE